MAVLKVLIVAEQFVGRGEKHDPARMITQFWTPDGQLVGEVDPFAPKRCARTGEWLLTPEQRSRVEEDLSNEVAG